MGGVFRLGRTGQVLKDALLKLVDEDTMAFNGIIDAIRLPRSTEAEKQIRHQAIQDATRHAIEVPFQVMELSLRSFEVIQAMVEIGNPSSITDAGVGALCARAAVRGALMNVQVNASDLEDQQYVGQILEEGEKMAQQADQLEAQIRQLVADKIN